MAHSCPECGQACYCGGDVDDCFIMDDASDYCCHCPEGGREDDDDWYDDPEMESL